MSGYRILRAVVLAGLAALVLYARVFVAFDAVRAKLVQAPTAAAAGRVRATTAGFPQVDGLRTPVALIARISSRGTGATKLAISVDGSPVCERLVSGGTARRVDCAVTSNWKPAGPHEVVVSGPATPWSLDYLELATHHGNASGGIFLLILPRTSSNYIAPHLSWIALTWLLVAALLLLPAPELPRAIRLLYGIGVGVVVAIFAVSVCAEWFSPYRIVLSAGTFVRWLLLLFLPRMWFAIRWLVRGEDGAVHPRVAVARALVVALLTLAAFDGFVNALLRDFYGGNYSGLLLLSESGFDRNPLLNGREEVRRSLVLPKGGGYDAQFMYFATFDPFLRAYKDTPSTYRVIMDAPPYRYGRIGFSLLTRVFSAGQWQRYPVTMVWLILGSLGMAAFVLALMAQDRGLSPAMGALIVLVPGFWQSMQAGLPEPIAAAALLGGIFCLSRTWWWPAGALFALSLLVRETGVVAVACVLGAAIVAGHGRPAVRTGVLAFGVILLWRLYVGWMLFPDWGIQGFLYHPSDLTWPLAGFADLWRAIAHGAYFPGAPELSRAGLVYPLLLISGFVLAAALAVAAPSAANIAALVYGCIAISLNFPAIWVHVGNGQRGTFELFVMIALSCMAMRTYRRSIRAALIVFWSATAAYVLFGALDAGYIRAALQIPF